MGDRMGDVKNKQPAPMQISAEQILREARERQEDENYTAPAQKITDPEELAVYRLRERKHFEDRLRMSRNAMGTWLKYASFEEAQRDFERARSVYERALDVDHRNTTVWLKYAASSRRAAPTHSLTRYDLIAQHHSTPPLHTAPHRNAQHSTPNHPRAAYPAPSRSHLAPCRLLAQPPARAATNLSFSGTRRWRCETATSTVLATSGIAL
jgi:tetratricopeptide (TPR) repeat protein